MPAIGSRIRRGAIAGLLGGLAFAACDDAVKIEFPVPVDDRWWDGFGDQGLNDYVYVLGEFEGDLVAGGLFTAAGTTPSRSIARWDGSEWSPFGEGMLREDCGGTSCKPFVSALATFEGSLVAGGRFTAAGGAPAANIARWDGAAWSPLGEGFDNTVFALAVYQGELVAGGVFTQSGADTTVRYLARWDGASWKPLGGGTNGIVRALLVWDASLVVGGDFTLAGSVPAGYVGLWDGQDWTLPSPFLNARVRAAASFQGDLVLAGDFYRVEDGSIYPGSVVTWGGTGWGEFGDLEGDAAAIAVYHDEIVVGGEFTYNQTGRFARWEERRWVGFGSGLDRFVTSALVLDDHLYVGGWFRFAGNKSSRYIARWDD